MLAAIAHPSELIEARLVDRYQRFIAELELDDGKRIRAHCVNPGQMEGWVIPGSRCWVSRAPLGSKRKLQYTWELMEHEDVLVGVNTTAPNRMVERLLRDRLLPGLKRYSAVHREKRVGSMRVDFLLEGKTPHLVEVKNCHLLYEAVGYFPDSVSARASHHLEVLAEQIEAGAKATLVMVVQDPRAKAVRPSALHDPVFADTLRRVARQGLRVRALRVEPTLKQYLVRDEISVDTKVYDPSSLRPFRERNRPRSGWRPDPRRRRESQHASPP